jgi:hypothetical protein
LYNSANQKLISIIQTKPSNNWNYSNRKNFDNNYPIFYRPFFTKLSISKNFSFIKLNPKAPADAAKTEASSGAFIPTENVIAKAKISKSHPLSFAENEVLNPIIKQNPNKISNRVEAHPINGINDGGIIGFSVRVYFKKLSQLPHAETSLLHKPKRSPTAERKPTPMDIRKKSLTTFTFIVSFLGTLKVHLMKMKLFLNIDIQASE